MASDPEVKFPLVTDALFPDGLRCENCGRLIHEGQPFTAQPESVLVLQMENGVAVSSETELIETLTCVYCVVPSG